MKMDFVVLMIFGIAFVSLMSLQTNAKSTLFFNDTFSNCDNFNLTQIGTDANCSCSSTGASCMNGQRARLTTNYFDGKHALPNLSTNNNNFTCEFYDVATSDVIGFGNAIRFRNTNDTDVTSELKFNLHYRELDGGDPEMSWCDTVTPTTCIGNIVKGTHKNSFKVFYSTNTSFEIYANNTFKGLVKQSAGVFGNATTLDIIPSSSTDVNLSGIACYNGTSPDDGILVIANSTPSIAINSPTNNSLTHNQTLLLNWTITDAENDNLSYFVWLDKNSNPITLWNYSNGTQGNFTFIRTLNFTFSNDAFSLNGTYYIKINGTTNQSQVFNIVHSFNLTNNISSYNATNVSLTPLPLNPNTATKCHYNITNFGGSQINDNISITDLRWWINRTQYKPANNLTTLDAGNVTNNANITCEARINNGFGETSWTQYVNSSQATVGDTIAPTITNQSINGNSFTTEQRVNLTAICTDNVIVDNVKVEHNGTGAFANSTMTLIGNNLYSYNALFAVGSYNSTKFYCIDGSGNIANDTSNFTWTVTSVGGGGGSSSGGGGGGGGSITIIEEIIELSNISLLLKPPIIASNYIYAALKTGMTRYSITLMSNKVLKSCESKIFECHIKNSTATISVNYSSNRFINVVKEPITIIDRSQNAKTIDAKVRFINLGVAIPMDTDTASRNYIVFRLKNGLIDGIRVWFVIAVLIGLSSGIYFYSKYG